MLMMIFELANGGLMVSSELVHGGLINGDL